VPQRGEVAFGAKAQPRWAGDVADAAAGERCTQAVRHAVFADDQQFGILEVLGEEVGDRGG